jgi:NADH-quinone oxidoreductase subunit H
VNSVQYADQIFVLLKQWLVSLFPAPLQTAVGILITVVTIICVFPALFAVTTILERKGLGRIQNRYGPNRVGPFGIFQPIADGVKALTKEDLVPANADKIVHFLAPVMLVIIVFLAYAVLPMGRNMAAVNMDCGLLFFFAIGSATEVAVFMAGWSSRNKYALLGAMRAIAQMISYEIPLMLSAVAAIMIAGTLNLQQIVEQQAGYSGILPHWYVFTPWGLAAFLLFIISATAESNRSPFDLPEGESEIIAGYYIEYSGFKFALFFLGEYLGMFSISAIAITLFLGGWSAPFSFLAWIPSYLCFFGKLVAMICCFIWVRGTLPRLRQDQLMNFAWKFMLPMSLFVIASAVCWRYAESWQRWALSLVVVAVPYLWLGHGMMNNRKLEQRVYRYAE